MKIFLKTSFSFLIMYVKPEVGHFEHLQLLKVLFYFRIIANSSSETESP